MHSAARACLKAAAPTPPASRRLCSSHALPITHEHRAAALCRSLSPALVRGLTQSEMGLAVDVDLALKQHEAYVEALCAAVGQVVTLSPLPEHPDAVFVEDTAVFCGDRAALCVPGHESRQGEVPSIARALAGMGVGIACPASAPGEGHVTVCSASHEDASDRAGLDALQDTACSSTLASGRAAGVCVDGGDVLNLGRELLVGVSSRTSRGGVTYLHSVFHGMLPVSGVDLQQLHSAHGSLHLKSLLSVVGEDCVAVPDSPVGVAALQQLLQASTVYGEAVPVLAGATLNAVLAGPVDQKRTLFVVPVPDWEAANAVFANGTLIIKCASEAPRSAAVFEAYARAAGSQLGVSQVLQVATSEVSKVDGALTCCSILL